MANKTNNNDLSTQRLSFQSLVFSWVKKHLDHFFFWWSELSYWFNQITLNQKYISTPLHDDVSEKIREYRPDYDNRSSHSISFIPSTTWVPVSPSKLLNRSDRWFSPPNQEWTSHHQQKIATHITFSTVVTDVVTHTLSLNNTLLLFHTHSLYSTRYCSKY